MGEEVSLVCVPKSQSRHTRMSVGAEDEEVGEARRVFHHNVADKTVNRLTISPKSGPRRTRRRTIPTKSLPEHCGPDACALLMARRMHSVLWLSETKGWPPVGRKARNDPQILPFAYAVSRQRGNATGLSPYHSGAWAFFARKSPVLRRSGRWRKGISGWPACSKCPPTFAELEGIALSDIAEATATLIIALGLLAGLSMTARAIRS